MKNPNEIKILHDLSKAIVGVSSMEEVCHKILDETARFLHVGKASIMKLDGTDGTLKVIAAKGMSKNVLEKVSVKVGVGISGHVFKSRKPVLINDIRSSKFTSRKGYKSRSLISTPLTCFPMNVGVNPIGVINVTDRRNGKPFTADDMQVLNTIANQTAAYLHLCDLAFASQKAKHLMREIEIARGVQQKLLPRHAPVVAGFEFAGKCMTAEHVGGDYFDFLVGGVRPPTVVVADVSGHSVGAAMMMSAFRSAVRSENAMFSPALMAEKLNAILFDDLAASEQFISMIYLQLMTNAEKTSIKYTTAGHYPPLILNGAGFINHATEDILLGVERFSEYHEKRIDVEKGNVIVLYTDGLIEAANKRGVRFGMDRLKQIVRKHSKGTAKNIIEEICAAVTKFVDNKAFRDDVTVVAVKVNA